MLYKITNKKRESVHGGIYRYPGKGVWTKEVKQPVICRSGYHLTTMPSKWIVPDGVVWTAEGRGEVSSEDDKTVFKSVRLIEKVGTLTADILASWAADCAHHVLHIFEQRYPYDNRPRKAIEAARSKDSYVAAYAAHADDAANTAYNDDATNAAYAALATTYAAYVASDVSRYYDATNAAYAARHAAYAAGALASGSILPCTVEENWQNERLLKYLKREL